MQLHGGDDHGRRASSARARRSPCRCRPARRTCRPSGSVASARRSRRRTGAAAVRRRSAAVAAATAAPAGSPRTRRHSRGPARPRPRVLVADDNADMRDYLTRLLRPHWDVESGRRRRSRRSPRSRRPPPDLVAHRRHDAALDGFGLLRALRERPSDRGQLPVIMLSARAGEEARDRGPRGRRRRLPGQAVLRARAGGAGRRRTLELQPASAARARGTRAESTRVAEQPTAPRTSSSRCSATSCAIPLAPILTALELMQLRGAPSSRRSGRSSSARSAPGPAGRRPARRLAHHARQDRAADRAPSSSATSSRKAIEMASPLLEQRAPAARSSDVPQTGLRGRRRSGAARAGRRQPAHQRGEVHRAGRADRSSRPSARATSVRIAVTDDGHRHRAGDAAARLRHVRAGAPGARPLAGRARPGADHRASLVELHGGTVERAERRPGEGQRVRRCRCRRPADGRAASARAERQARRARPHPPSRSASWSSTTTRTPPTLLADGARAWGTRRASRTTDRRRSRCSPSSRPTVALLDIGLPGDGRLRAGGRLRPHPALGNLQLVAVTGYGQAADRA